MQKTYSSHSAWRPALLAVLLGGAAVTGARAQALNYPAANVSVLLPSSGYTDLTGGSVISTANTDDASSALTDIGFSFSFGGNTFTQFSLNTNGFIRLGAVPTAPFFNTGSQILTGGPFSSAANVNLIAPFNVDLQSGAAGGTEYRVATTGGAGSRVTTIQWKNVSDKARLSNTGGTQIPKQFDNMSFQVKLYEGSNAVEFVYGTFTPSSEATTALFATVGLKGAGTGNNQYTVVQKASNVPWALPTVLDGYYAAAANGFNVRNYPTTGGSPSSVLPEPGRTYRFEVPVANDASVALIYGIDQIPSGQGFVYRAVVRNVGTNATAATTATLTLSGANSGTQSQAVGALATGAQTTLTFNNVVLSNAGNTTVTVSLPNDGNNTNNVRTATTVVNRSNPTTAGTFSYIVPGVPSSGSYGFQVNAGGAFTSAFCSAFTTNSQFRATTVRAYLGADVNSSGQTVYGIIADLNGNVLERSADYVIQPSDLSTLHEFALNSTVNVPAGTFLAGLAQVVDQTAYFPMAVQTETPQRVGTFYTLTVDPSGNTPTDISTNATVQNIRYMVEAAGFGPALATASASLARAFTLYPNPSTDGLFSLAVRGANAPGGLGVEVSNQLGQRVYTGSVRDNLTSTLDLSGLAPGLYQLTLRNGNEFTTTKVSITH